MDALTKLAPKLISPQGWAVYALIDRVSDILLDKSFLFTFITKNKKFIEISFPDLLYKKYNKYI